jgi:hypothetical protein
MGAFARRQMAAHPAHRDSAHRRRRLREELRLLLWIASNSSSERPEPTATHVSGDSAR